MRVCCSFAMPRWLFAEKVLDVLVKLAGCRIENSIVFEQPIWAALLYCALVSGRCSYKPIARPEGFPESSL